jgi:hypothetical protein
MMGIAMSKGEAEEGEKSGKSLRLHGMVNEWE